MVSELVFIYGNLNSLSLIKLYFLSILDYYLMLEFTFSLKRLFEIPWTSKDYCYLGVSQPSIVRDFVNFGITIAGVF